MSEQRTTSSASPVPAPTSPVKPEDLAVTLAVREDLGHQHDDAVIAEFLGRVGAEIDARVDERVAQHRVKGGGDSGLAFISIALGIPISAITVNGADGAGGLVALAIAWAGIAAVNFAHRRG